MRIASLLMVGALACGASPARARIENLRVSAEGAWSPTLFSTPSDASLAVAAAAAFRHDTFELAAGARVEGGGLVAPLGFGAFMRGSVCGVLGVWRPALGLELEATTATRAAIDPAFDPTGSLVATTAHDDAHNTLRAGLAITPLRFQWDHLFVGGPGLRVSTPLRDGEIGERLYAVFSLAEVGWLL